MRSDKTTFFFALFSFLFSGLSFFSLPSNSESFVGAIIVYLAVFVAVLFLLKGLAFLKSRVRSERNSESIPFCILGIIACAFVFCFFTNSFSDFLPEISGEYTGSLFSFFFVIISLFLALYVGKRGLFSYGAVCLVTLPVLLAPTVFTCFNFLDFGGVKEFENAGVSSVHFDLSLVPDAFLACAGGCALVFLSDEKKKMSLSPAFFAFIIAVICEGVKYFLWFGTKNLPLISRPDRVMLAQVPYVNVQELFIFSYYLSYMTKISLIALTARKFAERLTSRLSTFWQYFLCAFLFFALYLFGPKESAKTLAVFSFCALYLLFVAEYLSKIIKCGKITDRHSEKSNI